MAPYSVDPASHEGRRKKRVKRWSPDLTRYARGSIIRMKLRNFMSIALSEYHFGPKMNMIMGPNGTGKSTFVCAVCIALAGKLDYLGKGNMVLSQFIKTGEDRATIELEMKGDSEGETIVIDKDLYRDEERTSWLVNGESYGELKLRRLLKEYNVQLSNLCQFLPQDRVARFASLKPEELLKEIERICGDGHLLEEHQQLITYYNDLVEKKKALEETQTRLEELHEKGKELQEHAEKLEEFKRLQKQMQGLKTLHKYALKDAKKAKRDELEAELELKKQELKTYEEQVRPWMDSLRASDDTARETETAVQRVEAQHDKCASKIQKAMQKVDAINEKINDLNTQKMMLNSEIETQQKKLARDRELYTKCKHAIENLDMLDEDQAEMLRSDRDRLSEEQLEAREQSNRLREDMSSKNSENSLLEQKIHRLKQQLNSSDRLMTLDRNRWGKVIRSVEMVRADREKLHLHCAEPPVVSLNVKDPRIAPAMERLIRRNDMTAFTVTNKFEYDKLTKYLYESHPEAGRGVAVRTLGKHVHYEPKISRDLIRKLGFDGYAVDYIDGPREVVEMLCDQEQLQNTPIAFSELSPDQLQRIVAGVSQGRWAFPRIVVGDSMYQFQKSRFGSQQTYTTERTIPQRVDIFKTGVSAEQRALAESRIQEMQEQHENNRKELEGTASELRHSEQKLTSVNDELREVRGRLQHQKKQKAQHEKYVTQLNTLKDAIKLAQANIRRMRERGSDNDELGNVLKAIDTQETKKLELLSSLGGLFKEMGNLEQESVEKEVLRIQEENKALSINELSGSIAQTRAKLQGEKEDLITKVRDAKADFNATIVELKQQFSQFSDEEKAEIKELRSSLEERNQWSVEGVESEITRIRSMIRLRRDAGGFSVEMLEDNKREVEALERALPAEQEEVAHINEQIERVESEWRPELEAVVNQISIDFANNLSFVASGGDVQLDTESPNYAEWKLRILVSFRDAEEMVQLNAAQQSGGEKSVTTAVFLNSLQGLANVPFRIVDEINQGMDATNERRVHKMIVQKAVSTPGAAQYFLITPKLLTHLVYSKNMDVECIYAGRYMPMPENTPEFLEMGVA